MKDSRFRFTSDGEIYFRKEKTEYYITKNAYAYWVTKKGCAVTLPQDYLADAKEAARQIILAEEEDKRVWVVISEWNLEDRNLYGSAVHGVFKDYQVAKKRFVEEAIKAKADIEPMSTHSEEDSHRYAVWELGNYTGNHITVKIVESEITEE